MKFKLGDIVKKVLWSDCNKYIVGKIVKFEHDGDLFAYINVIRNHGYRDKSEIGPVRIILINSCVKKLNDDEILAYQI
jgi:hypothetical protein